MGATATPTAPSLRWNEDGTWRSQTRREFAVQCGRVAAALAAIGIERGDRVGIVGPSSPWWLTAALGAQAAGGVTVGAYPTSAPPQLRYVFGHSGARFLFVANAALLANVTRGARRAPRRRACDRVRRHRRRAAPGRRVESLATFLDRAELSDDDAAAYLHDVTATLDPDDLCTIVYTSGTTGEPKGALHSFHTISQCARTVIPAMGYRADDEYIVHLPLNHTAEQTYTVVMGSQVGWTMSFARSAATLADDLCDVRPTDHVRGAADLREGAHRDRGGRRRRPARTRSRASASTACASRCAAARRCRRRRCRSSSVTGCASATRYGMTEGGAIACPWDRTPRPETCGIPFPGVEITVDDDGEILVRSDGVCLGYYRDPDASKAMFTDDGFLRTGDLGRWNDGELEIIGRKKEVIITSGGKNINPSGIENALTRDPYINQAVVIGNDRNYLVAVVEIAAIPVQEFLAAQGITTASFEEMVGRREVDRAGRCRDRGRQRGSVEAGADQAVRDPAASARDHRPRAHPDDEDQAAAVRSALRRPDRAPVPLT